MGRRKKGRKMLLDCGVHYVRCEICGLPTRMTGTCRCDRCWELETRLRMDPALAVRILQGIEKNGSKIEVEDRELTCV
jgi:hypothetical protein